MRCAMIHVKHVAPPELGFLCDSDAIDVPLLRSFPAGGAALR
jgi:hypothetical protein